VLLPLALLALGCGSQTEPQIPEPGGEISCPAPIDTIVRENCTAIADDFGALSFRGALQVAGSSRGSEQRIDAIQQAGILATAIKDRRVRLCEDHNACKVSPKDHVAEDKRLTDLMKALIDTWDNRKFANPDGVAQFSAAVGALQGRLQGARPGGPQTAKAGASATAASGAAQDWTRINADTLANVQAPGVTFTPGQGTITVTTAAGAARDVLRSAPEQLQLKGGQRYQIRVSGTYSPTVPALIAPGDDISVRLKYRTTQASDLVVALRSLEDPDATDTTTSWSLTAGASGSQEATFTANPGASGFYVGIGVRGSGTIDLDDIELIRGGTPVAAVRAEAASEPSVATSCAVSSTKPLAGKSSLRCEAGTGDRLTIGLPPGYLYMAVRGRSSGERAALRTLSLEGGRSLDAALAEDAEFVVGLAGAGTATLRTIEIRTVGK
jgi:hypothetical protein